ncbi:MULTISPECIES: DUF3152 domain-containing protein [Streptomyces]|uniref:DUF3152 domain-containing protein n=1 Tax=Streptomyces siderophoricus TaxID=2802281 RepID=A0ABS1MKE4_9ACTN|nr:DUF3152 domain-containing protein [Streptomyces sp. 9-7]MBL1088508.1 DUF3152 domain-containing protein [Streptomyces sp. 9-7]
MGRHSRRDRPEAEDPSQSTAPPGQSPPAGRAPAPGPGPGRRRREPAGGGPVRGGHPEQREPGGAWGAFPGVPASPMTPGTAAGRTAPGAPGQAAPRIPRPRAEMAPGAPPMAVPGTGSGPRRDYVAAFDAGQFPRRPDGPGDALDADGADDDVFRAGAPGAVRTPAASVAYGGPNAGDAVGGAAGPRVPEPAGPADRDPDEDFAAGADAAFDEPRHGARRGGKGRTFTGAAAAAVTTVLAVVIAGQVAEQHKDGGDPQPRSGNDRTDAAGDEASRSQSRPTQDAKPAGYDEQMAQAFPLDAHLTASGRFKPVGGDAEAPGRGKVLRYRVDIEEGLPLDGTLFAEAVHKTLNDDRSWAHGGQRTFQRVASGPADFVITLASPGTTAKWCAKSGLDTYEENVSCDSAATDRVMINAYRWAQGAQTYGRDKMHAYRQMLINHEVGHRLGHNHEGCTRQGALAPVMMQQTKFLTTDGVTCRPNSWPYPTAH